MATIRDKERCRYCHVEFKTTVEPSPSPPPPPRVRETRQRQGSLRPGPREWALPAGPLWEQGNRRGALAVHPTPAPTWKEKAWIATCPPAHGDFPSRPRRVLEERRRHHGDFKNAVGVEAQPLN